MKPNWTIYGESHPPEKWKSLLSNPAYEGQPFDFLREWWNQDEAVTVQTSGSTGIPKNIQLRKDFMQLSAKATAEYFDLGSGSKALMALPADFIGGKMMIVRADVNEWRLTIIPPKAKPELPDSDFDFLSLTPMQCSLLLEENVRALDRIGVLLLGGSPISGSLMKELQKVKAKAYLGFGMTETSSHVALRRLNGTTASELYHALPGWAFEQLPNDGLSIRHLSSADRWETNDQVEVKNAHTFRWKGRLDHVINSGGVKINPEEIENQLSADFPFAFYITYRSDEVLGQKLILIAEQNESADQRAHIESRMSALPAVKRPKEIYIVNNIERTANGKIKRNPPKK